MELNSKALQEVVQLNLDLVKVNNQISRIKELISQLLQDKCDLSVSFKMHNETRCEENKSVITELQDHQFYMTGILGAAFGIPRSMLNPLIDQKPCKNELNFEVTDTNGVRILSILLSEKEEAKRLMIDRLNQLINPVTISFPDDPNPIHHRYAAE